MAIIDIVKYEQEVGVIVHKFPSCDLRWGLSLSYAQDRLHSL